MKELINLNNKDGCRIKAAFLIIGEGLANDYLSQYSIQGLANSGKFKHAVLNSILV